MIDFARYVGLPWQPRGCWELLRLVYLEQLGITLPTYADDYACRDHHQVGQLIMAESRAWQPVAAGSERAGDAVLFQVAGEPSHVGVVATRQRFLHMLKGQAAVIESYRGLAWARRLVGFYRHGEAA